MTEMGQLSLTPLGDAQGFFHQLWQQAREI